MDNYSLIYIRNVVVLANSIDSGATSMENWFIFNISNETWTKHKLTINIHWPSTPNWFLIPILGQLYLFLPEQTLRFDSGTSNWIEMDSLIDLPLQDIKVLSIAHNQ